MDSRVRELESMLSRMQRLSSSSDAAVNIEYLKTCVCKFMSSREQSERQRLVPVIAAVLQLSPAEKKKIELAVSSSTEEADDGVGGLTSLASYAVSIFS